MGAVVESQGAPDGLGFRTEPLRSVPDRPASDRFSMPDGKLRVARNFFEAGLSNQGEGLLTSGDLTTAIHDTGGNPSLGATSR